MGMAHRGRLNTLANVVRKPAEVLMAEANNQTPDETLSDGFKGDGDAKYHLGTSYTRTYPSGKSITITLLANPSHLETVNPVVSGRARAEQHFLGGDAASRTKVIPIQIHGDGAFAGQGVVSETLQMQDLKNYTVGGTIHIIMNNQIAFTTTPDRGRSGTYSSDVAKMINAPIFHVNGDSMEEVAKTFGIAAEYRQKFGKDVVIDLIGYRQLGHNELDNPSFTSPLTYKIVKNMKPTKDIYKDQLIAEGIDKDILDKIEAETEAYLEAAHVKSKTHKFGVERWENEAWLNIKNPTRYGRVKDTGVELGHLKAIGMKISQLPTDSKFHKSVANIYKDRMTAIETGKGISWGQAEALAFATLIDEGYHVRLSGQDVERGTFSHRHAHVFYQDRDGSYIPINSVIPDGSGVRNFIAAGSHLSEYAVLGFEYGYAQTNPNTLCLWEA